MPVKTVADGERLDGNDPGAMPQDNTVERVAALWNLTDELARRRCQPESEDYSVSRQALDTTSMKAAALWYAENGIPVFPLHNPIDGGCSCGKNPSLVPDDEVCGRSRGKHPRTDDGFKSATNDLDQITQWWDRWPDANIGIPTGALTGLLVLDNDPRNGGPADRNALIVVIGPIPETAEVRTGGDGRHIYLRYGGGRVRKELTKGIDLKGDGGYVVAPPSQHYSGKRYEWDCPGGMEAILNPAPVPDWLPKFIAGEPAKKPDKTKAAVTDEAFEKVGPGKRNPHLVSQAGAMKRRNMSEDAIAAALLVENRERCDPPKTDAEVRQIAKSVARYPAAATVISAPEAWSEIIPLNSHVPDEFPPNVLPVWLGEMAMAVSVFAETPFEMAALLAVAVAAACVSQKADVSPEPGYIEPLNLYVCAAMESGNRKTAVFTNLVAPLMAWERAAADRVKPERNRLLSERKTLEARIEALRKRAARV